MLGVEMRVEATFLAQRGEIGRAEALMGVGNGLC